MICPVLRHVRRIGFELATGLHQTTLEYVPEMILAFGVLRRMGEWVLASGFLLWFLNGLFSHHRETSLAWRGAGAICWLFGSVLVFFGTIFLRVNLPSMRQWARPVRLRRAATWDRRIPTRPRLRPAWHHKPVRPYIGLRKADALRKLADMPAIAPDTAALSDECVHAGGPAIR